MTTRPIPPETGTATHLAATTLSDATTHVPVQKLGAELEDMDTFLQERGQNSANSVLNWEDFQALLDD